jgi:hypothetical protein
MAMLRTSLLLAAGFCALPALADTHIAYVDDAGQPATQIYVKGNKVRMEGGKGQGVAIYDVASNSMTVLMPDQNKYLVLDEKAADQMGTQMNAAQAQAQAAMNAHQADIAQAQQQMQAAMAQMTPEQRAQMQQMMGGQTPEAAPAMQAASPKFEMQDLGTTETVAGHSCRDMQMVMNGRPLSSLCVTDSLASFGIASTDMKTLERMRDNMQKLSNRMGPMAQGMSAMLSKGFTLKSTHQVMEDYKRVNVTDTFKSVSNSGLAGSLFEIPAGYNTQTTMAEMMQQGHP